MIGFPFTILDETDSTNNYAMRQIEAGNAVHGAAFLAKHQTAGKGQRGKKWENETGKNIALSVLLNVAEMQAATHFQLIATVALAAFDLIEKYGSDDTKIKWMNDIYWRDRKAVGILIENKYAGKKWQWAIAGTGINVNQTAFDASIGRKAVSLKQITGKDFDCVDLSKELCTFLDTRFCLLKENKFDELLYEYNKNLFGKEAQVNLKFDNQIYNCTVRNVDAAGNLWIEGAPKPYFGFGEIEWIL